jgi:alpha-glucosidase
MSDGKPPQKSAAPWWHDAVVYQLYVPSYSDVTGDGWGDFAGIRERLDHLAALGVNGIWLSPCYPSPQWDHGYDVADYMDINPTYGDLNEFDHFIREAHARNIRVLMDIVPNHCSFEHAWFKKALASAPGSKERDHFYFRDGKGTNGELPPNNWRSVFGGTTWTRITEANGAPGQWYLHTFAPQQPDFNWSNQDVVDHFDDVLRFWFDRGVDGFRVDAVAVAGKAPGLPDAPPVPAGVAENDAWSYNPNTVLWPAGHDAWKHWRTVINEYERTHPGRDLVTVSEAYTVGRPEEFVRYLTDEFHQSFAFDVMLAPWIASHIHQAIANTVEATAAIGAIPAWTVNNHDTQRAVTRLGRANATDPASFTGNNLVYVDAPVDVELGRSRARALITLAAALPGTLYIYQGEELGLEEYLDLPADARQDPIFTRTEGREIGRDGCRIPLPWTPDAATAFGFSSPNAQPWLPQPTHWGALSAQVQLSDPTSMLRLYQSLLAERPQLSGPLTWVQHPDLPPSVVAFERTPSTGHGTLITANIAGAEVALPPEVLAGRTAWFSSHDRNGVAPTVLGTDTCVWWRR